MKSKQFKKRYAGTVKNAPETGVRSGRAIGVPAGGAIGGGDDYKQKIGRNKIPWTRTGFKGSPSQSADAGFSSFLGRVNKGYEEVEQEEMFPDQSKIEDEPEEEFQSVRQKVPKYTGAGGSFGYPTRESKTMTELRDFIREAVKEELKVVSRDLSQPEGYQLFDDDYYSEDRREEEDETGVVAIKTDDGYINAHPKEALKELRSFIRLSLTRDLFEAKKKILKSDEEEEKKEKEKKKKKKAKKEATTTSAVAGYTGPMSAPKNAKKFYADMEKAYHGTIIGDIPKPKP